MSSAWKRKAWVSSQKVVAHEVNGTVVKFSPVSAEKAFSLRGLSEPIGKLIGVFSVSTKNDVAQKTRTIRDNKEDSQSDTLEIEAIDPALAAQRAKSREEAIVTALNGLLGADNIRTIAALVIDSMKEDFPRDSKDNPSPDEFLAEVELPAFGQMIVGLCKANAEVFGATGKLIAGLVEEKMTAKLAEVSGSRVPASEGQSESPESGILGSISPTKSNGSPPEGTTPAGF
jgi:hypothetical protein